MQIHWHHTKWVGDEQKAQIEERIHALADQGHNDLIDVRISGNPSKRKGHEEHEVRITCEARGQEIVATSTAPKLERALHDALESFKQQVRSMRAKRKDHRGPRLATAVAAMAYDEADDTDESVDFDDLESP